jgi:hypothetical protein
VSLQISDEHGVEARIKAMGQHVWSSWVDLVRPHLLEDPSPTNGDLVFDETNDDQVWIPETNAFVVFLADKYYVYLLNAVDLFDEVS